MPQLSPIGTSETEQFLVGESDFAFFSNYTGRNEDGAILFCVAGSAEATVNQTRAYIERNSLILLLPGSLLMLTNRSTDFRMKYCAFSRGLFAEAGFRLEPPFFRFLMEKPISNLDEGHSDGILIWLQMAEYTYNDKENIFRNTIIKNRLQNVLLEIYDKLQRFGEERYGPITTNRQAELFHRFISLVHEHCAREREVAFYADRLCISTRYLSTIVRNISNDTAKEIIDRSVMLEIKLLLHTTDLSVQEIAYQLHFPDQSYLGRFFKKYTGLSPTEFRNKK